MVEGPLCGACIRVEAFPYWSSFGGVAELSFEDGESGKFDVQIRVRELTVEEEHVVYQHSTEINGAPRELLIPHMVALQFGTNFGVHDPAELEICVDVDGERLARRGLAIVLED